MKEEIIHCNRIRFFFETSSKLQYKIKKQSKQGKYPHFSSVYRNCYPWGFVHIIQIEIVTAWKFSIYFSLKTANIKLLFLGLKWYSRREVSKRKILSIVSSTWIVNFKTYRHVQIRTESLKIRKRCCDSFNFRTTFFVSWLVTLVC